MKKQIDVKARLRRIILGEMSHCIGKPGGQLSNQRDILKKKYLGYGYAGDDKRSKRGYSTYVDRTVMEAVEWAKPSLFRVFTTTDDIIRFEPKTPEQEQAAADATLYVNNVIFGREMFRLVHDVLADGLYQRVGWCIAHSPIEKEQKLLEYEGLTEPEAMALLMDPAMGITEDGDNVEVAQNVGADGLPLYNVRIRKTVEHRTIRLDAVPSERVVLSSDAPDVEHARFIAHWEIKSRSDLIREGYSPDVVDELPAYDSDDDAPETVTGREINAEDTADWDSLVRESRLYQVWEAWVDCDVNGDGLAEKVKCTYVGGEDSLSILGWEEWPLYRAPLFAACSVPMPHQAIGLCLADLVSDLQDVKTEMTRQLLDSLVLANQGEVVANEGESGFIDYDSLLARGAGGVIRCKGDASVTPLSINTSAQEALGGLTAVESVVERRTGITARTQALKADALQNTATGASIQEEAVNQRIELIARVYAETFFRPLGRYVLHLLHRYQDREVQVQLKGRFMSFDPRRWDPDMEISVAVGLGTGNKSKQLATFQQILQIQQAFIAQLGPASPVRLPHVTYTCRKMCEAAGLQAPERFFGTEEDARAAEQQILAQQKAKGQQMDPLTAAKVQTERVKAQTAMQKAQLDMRIKQAQLQQETQSKAVKAQSDAAAQQRKMELNAQLKGQELLAEKELDAMKLSMGGTTPGLTNIRQQEI
jgi:hypothetical protein